MGAPGRHMAACVPCSGAIVVGVVGPGRRAVHSATMPYVWQRLRNTGGAWKMYADECGGVRGSCSGDRCG